MRRNQVQRAIQVHASFLMHGNPIGAGFGKGRDVVVWIFDHQVAIEGHLCNRFAQRRHDRRADGEVRNEMPVHDVEMQDRASAVDGGERFGAELREIGGKNGRCEFNQCGAPSPLIIRGSNSLSVLNVEAAL